MGKNSDRLTQKRRAKAGEKAKKRRAEFKAQKAREAPVGSGDVPEDVFPAATRLFWLAHGVNCLLSDYKEGTWTPIFERIYEGVLPESQEAIQQRVLDRFIGRKEWPTEAKAALAWTVSSPKLLFVYWHEAMRKMQHAHPELDPPEVERLIRRPADPCVWDLFHYQSNRLLLRKSA